MKFLSRLSEKPTVKLGDSLRQGDLCLKGGYIVRVHPETPSPLRERVGVRVSSVDFTPLTWPLPLEEGEETIF
jgi:hypothetical protein